MSLIVDGTTGVTFNDSSLQGAAASPYVLKNRIINGDMRIDQRNAGASVTPSSIVVGTYGLDRWATYGSQASKFSVQQNASSVTPPAGFTNYIGVTVGASANVTVGAADIFQLYQSIEGYNVTDLNYGTADAKTVTISFWVRSSLTGTFSGSVYSSSVMSYPFTYTISAANTWEQKSITIAGTTAYSLYSSTNNVGLTLTFDLGAGSTYTATANAWGAGVKTKATGSVNLISTNSATLYITGVQLEIGSTATPFERRLYGQELINCQRYFQAQIIDIGNAAILSGNVTNGVSYYGSKTLQVAMRASPTLTWGTQWGVNGFAASAPTADWLGADGFRFYKAANATINGGYIFQAWNVSAEL